MLENGGFIPTSGAVVYPGRTEYDGFTNRKEAVCENHNFVGKTGYNYGG